MLIVQSPEHVLHQQHELVLREAGHARREFGLVARYRPGMTPPLRVLRPRAIGGTPTAAAAVNYCTVWWYLSSPSRPSRGFSA
jgi:hypothetical protein